MPSEQVLTESQWVWLHCQMLLDEQLQACPSCDVVGIGPFCTACGARLAEAVRLCEACQYPGTGTYCAQCGAVLHSPVEEAIDEGTFDWEAWASSLRPFLGGLTAQEQTLLQQEGAGWPTSRSLHAMEEDDGPIPGHEYGM